jgi:hypothetical protein
MFDYCNDDDNDIKNDLRRTCLLQAGIYNGWIVHFCFTIILRFLKNSIYHSCANRNLLIIKQIPAGVYPDAIGARMTDSKKSIFQKTLIIITFEFYKLHIRNLGLKIE